jgi:predicted glycogen debranching enzyme
MIQFNQEVCGDLQAALRREWLETNGLGGFASSTITGLNTRRYHGLLVAATKPPVGRLVLLAKLEETLLIDGRRYELSANQYPGVIHPQGHLYLKEFRLDPFPVFTYQMEGLEIVKSLFMIYGENSTVIQYELRQIGKGVINEAQSDADCVLEVRPLIAFRDYHSTTHENSALNPHVEINANEASVTPYEGLPTLHLGHTAQEIDATGQWYRNFELQVERERGLDFKEDLFSPFALRFDLRSQTQAAIVASTERRDAGNVAKYRQGELERREAVLAAAPNQDPFVRSLIASADQYLVARESCKTVIAGYHWFGDWGRDTMIALPGLTLVTGNAGVAQSILREFALHIDRGMLPNRFPDAGEKPEYNTVDATLWYFEAVRALLDYTDDYEFVKTHLYAALVDIIAWHTRGTRFGIHVDADGLLAAGEEGVQLTWMDAKVGDYVVTPRRGKPVEIQALWHNALCVMEDLANKFGDEANKKRYSEMAAQAKRSFNNLFWNEEAGCLYDVVDKETGDSSIRPNQIIAVSLPHTMLSLEKARRVVGVVERELLTPLGLRSLAPIDPQYIARYVGGPWDRDVSYHQGTVWAWLMGPFITAYIKVNSQTVSQGNDARARATEWLAAFQEHLSDAGLNHISEIFDADSPHTPRGCVAQAWSVAEMLRATVEDVFNIKPLIRDAAIAK